MDIKLKMGAKASLPSSANKGTVYFAKDGDKNFGELYYDDENGNRVKVGGTNISKIEFRPEYQGALDGIYWKHFLRITNEDETYVDSEILPRADFSSEGVMSFSTSINEIQQMPVGIKSFYPWIQIGTTPYIDANNGYSLIIGDGEAFLSEDIFNEDINRIGMIQSPEMLYLVGGPLEDNAPSMLMALGVSGIPGFTVMPLLEEYGSGIRYINNYFYTDSLGAETEYIPAAYIEELHSSSIHSTMFTGAFTGDLEGTAKDAISWANSITLNDTLVKGGETAAITTNKWGVARTISISGTAGTTGTSVDGSAEDGYTLIIPATMTGFTSITSTDLLATNLGAASTPVAVSHFKETYFHNPNNNNYKHKLTSNAGSASCELQLPNTSGLLVSKPNATASVGDINSPVYVAMNGEVTACTTIAVDHGGTGSNSLATGAILVGNGTSAVATVAGTTAGRILVANGTSKAPIYASPTLSFSTGTGNPTLSLTINGSTYTTATGIQAATGENPGIVSTVAQTFGGAKTFSGAATFSAGITSTTGTFSGQINATSIKLSGQLKSHSAGTSYITLTDTRATMTSPTVHLNGTTIVLNSSNYGATLPTTDLEEGRIFFLLT